MIILFVLLLITIMAITLNFGHLVVVSMIMIFLDYYDNDLIDEFISLSIIFIKLLIVLIVVVVIICNLDIPTINNHSFSWSGC